MSDMLSGKTVVVTGAASGIGRAIAITAARHNAKAVIVADVIETPREGGTPTVAEIETMDVPARFVATDVTRRSDLDTLLAATAEFGGVDVMVCNAGLTLAADDADVTQADYQRLMDVNVGGVLFSAQAAATQMRTRGAAGSIVLMGSMGGLVGAGMTVAYSASKGAVVLLAKALADALGPQRIRVNAVCPGTIDTRMLRENRGVADAVEGFRTRTPLRRFGNPVEVAEAVAWLGSDLSSYVSGVALPVDGGLTAVI
jgi:NAD(P)-dependent dehydrogenase (short-subunit alcohol dehydrogenase family)